MEVKFRESPKFCGSSSIVPEVQNLALTVCAVVLDRQWFFPQQLWHFWTLFFDSRYLGDYCHNGDFCAIISDR